jgi:hypothetical protein
LACDRGTECRDKVRAGALGCVTLWVSETRSGYLPEGRRDQECERSERHGLVATVEFRESAKKRRSPCKPWYGLVGKGDRKLEWGLVELCIHSVLL